MRRAAIDVGTHSVRLLVADVDHGQIRPVLRRLEITRLGEGLDLGRVLIPQAIGRTVQAVREFWRIAHEAGAESVVVVGTSAVREALNRSTLKRNLHPIPLVVLDGDAEAELSFQGVLAGLKGLPDPLLVLDIGGGSTELVLGTGQRVVRKKSFPLGSVRLREQYLHSDPPADVELEALRREVLNCVRPHRTSLSGAIRAVGVGGTVTSLAAVDLSLDPYDPDRVHGHVLSAARVNSLTRGLCTMPLALRQRIPGLQPERADVICAGAAILDTLLALFRLEAVVASESDLLWGALLAF